MGVFHKNLADAKAALGQDNFSRAIEILEEHLNLNVLNAERDSLARISLGIRNYQAYLQRAVNTLKTQQNQSGRLLAERDINTATEHLKAIERRINRLLPEIKSEE